MKDIGLNTASALQDAPVNGLVIRDFFYIRPRIRDGNPGAGDIVTLGMWTGGVPITAAVINPKTGLSVNRDYTGVGALLDIPPIPANMELEVRTIRIRFSNLSAEMLAALRQYDARFAELEIHRGIFSNETQRLVDPAICRFLGFVNKAPIRTAPEGGEGIIELECTSNSRILTRTSGKLFSDEVMKVRSGDKFAQYTDVTGDWRIWWGQEEKVVGGDKERIKEKWIR